MYLDNQPIVTSDRRSKTNVETLDKEQCLDFVKALEPRQYKLKNGKSQRKHWGFIAQEVKSNALNVMGDTQSDDEKSDFALLCFTPGQQRTNSDVGGTDTTTESKFSLRYNELIAVLTCAVQRLEERLSVEESKTKALEEHLANVDSTLVNIFSGSEVRVGSKRRRLS